MKIFKYTLFIALTVQPIFADAQSEFKPELVMLAEVNQIYNDGFGSNRAFINPETGFGFSLGGYLTKNTTSRLTYQLGILYRYRIHNFNNRLFFAGGASNTTTENYQLQHLVIPFNALVKVSPKGQIVLGISADLLFAKKQKVQLDIREPTFFGDRKMSEYNDTPFSTSLGYRHRIASEVILSAIVNLSFANIDMPSLIEDSNSQRALQIEIHYKL